MRKRPEASGIRRTFRPVEGTGEGMSGPTGGLRGTSLPAAVLPKEATDKRPLSAHSVLNSITRHSSLKAKVESPQFRRGTPAGRSKSFSNHRPLEPEVFSQIEHSSQVTFNCTCNGCCHAQWCNVICLKHVIHVHHDLKTSSVRTDQRKLVLSHPIASTDLFYYLTLFLFKQLKVPSLDSCSSATLESTAFSPCGNVPSIGVKILYICEVMSWPAGGAGLIQLEAAISLPLSHAEGRSGRCLARLQLLYSDGQNY